VFARAADTPVHGNALIAIIEGLAFDPEVEIAPRGVFVDRGSEIVFRFPEVEVVIFVEQDGIAR
jgi:hypothetical protein